jgi:hypothetical protein
VELAAVLQGQEEDKVLMVVMELRSVIQVLLVVLEVIMPQEIQILLGS